MKLKNVTPVTILTAVLLIVVSACAASTSDSSAAKPTAQLQQADPTVSSTAVPTPDSLASTSALQSSQATAATQPPATQPTTTTVATQAPETLAVLPPEFNTAVTIINATSPNAGRTTLAQLIDGDKPVVLWSFAAWCPQCRAEAPAIDAFAAANPDIQVIGIGSLDTAEASVGFVQDTGVQNSTMVWADEAGGLWQLLGFSGRTERLVVSADLTQRQGPNGGQFDEARIRSQIASFN